MNSKTPKAATYEPMPGVTVEFRDTPLRPGIVTGAGFVGDRAALADAYAQLVLALSSHPRGKELAREYEYYIDPYSLNSLSPEEAKWAWQLACWRDPVLRRFFNAVGLAVYEDSRDTGHYGVVAHPEAH